MLILLKEVKKMVRQLRGKKNMFEYRSTAANQLYLLWCLFGNIYFTDKIHFGVKLFWYFMATCHLFLTYYVGVVFVLYNKKKTIMMTLYVIGLQFMGNVVQIGLPLMCYYCRVNIRSMIQEVDKIYQSPSSVGLYNNLKASLDPKRVIVGNLSFYVACNFIRLFSCILDAVIFYDEIKLNNYQYYIYPLPRSVNVTRLDVFLTINIVFNSIFLFSMMQWLALLAFMMFWTVICYNQLVFVCHKLAIETGYMTRYVEKTNRSSKAWNRAFERGLVQDVKKFQTIIRWVEEWLINLARKFIELFCTLVFPVVFVLPVTLLHHILSSNVPFCVLIKGIMGFVGLLWTSYLMFWIGEALDSSVSAVSIAVYSTPWYWSTKVRKHIHIFLGQTHKLKSFPIAKIHPLSFRTLAVYANGILSTYIREPYTIKPRKFQLAEKMIPVLLQELKKIIRQMVGSHNMFHYRSTPANQLHLLYCFCGSVYFAIGIHRQIKYLWGVMALCQIFTTYYMAFEYILYSRRKSLMMSLSVLSLVNIQNVFQFGLPWLSYHYRRHIESMIEKVDRMYQNRSGQVDKYRASLQINRIVARKISVYAVYTFVRIFVCTLDVILFYEESKIASYLYYIYPFPKAASVSSLSVFLTINGVFMVILAFFVFQYCCVLALILFWGIICHNELILLRDELDSRSSSLNKYLGFEQQGACQPNEEWIRIFRRTLAQGVRNFQRITQLINFLRGFVEIYSSLITLSSFLYQIALLYSLLSTNSPYSVMLKGITSSLSIFWAVYLLYWTGDLLESSVSALLVAVCSTPWYWSVQNRRDVYIFISQTQKFKNFSIIKVYPMVYRTFMAYVRGIFSFINVLHQITRN